MIPYLKIQKKGMYGILPGLLQVNFMCTTFLFSLTIILPIGKLLIHLKLKFKLYSFLLK
jgi:hypothetical protein